MDGVIVNHKEIHNRIIQTKWCTVNPSFASLPKKMTLFLNKVGAAARRGISGGRSAALAIAIRCISSKLYVGRLSEATDDHLLKEAFSRFGEVAEARILMDLDTGKSRQARRPCHLCRRPIRHVSNRRHGWEEIAGEEDCCTFRPRPRSGWFRHDL